ncbi:hypothetical protein OK016_28010 [Vibrio chagasii]|nr:hypothetical protein [Vibrio chagasii]
MSTIYKSFIAEDRLNLHYKALTISLNRSIGSTDDVADAIEYLLSSRSLLG